MTARRRRGRFVVLEGLDGAGTTTQVQRIADALQSEGLPVRITREPSDGPVGLLIRQALTGRLGLPHRAGPLSEEALALLFAADRRDHVDAEIAPALEQGQWVLCDRYLLSSLAYQGSALSMAWVESLNQTVLVPDVTLFLEVDLTTAARRRQGRGGPAELFEAESRQQKVARAYGEAIRRRARKEQIIRLAGGQSVEAVTKAALAVLEALR
jgi:dTMP kinase